MESSQPKSPVDSFFKGAIKSAGLALLAFGCFYGLGIVATMLIPGFTVLVASPSLLVGALPHIAEVGLWMVSGLGLFGGVMGVIRSKNEAREEQKFAIKQAQREAEMTPVIIPGVAMAADRAEGPDAAPAPTTTSRWADRADIAPRGDAIQKILADRSMNDQSRAAALLAEREQAAAAGPAARQ